MGIITNINYTVITNNTVIIYVQYHSAHISSVIIILLLWSSVLGW